MLKLLFLLFLMPTLLSIKIFPQTAPPLETGVSQTLAQWRTANYSDVRYKLNITLEKGAPLMKGTIEVSVKLTDEGAKNDLILDWRTTQFQNDKDKPFAEVERVNEQIVKETVPNGVFDYLIDKEHLVISKKYLKTGANTIAIKFASPIKTSGAAITRYVDKEDGAEYIYSLFVPSDASTAFPVFDQPDLKARFQLNVTATGKRKVISNTAANPYTVRYVGWEFPETQPISTYAFAFAAGDFDVFCDGSAESLEEQSYKPNARKSCANNSIYVRKSQAEKFKQHAAEVFRLNREGVKFLETYFDYKFPFPKYDLVLIPEFPFGGMEHAGATFLRESSVIFPTEPTKNDLVSRANVIFHEAAHQWFGDTVTMKWFDDLWLKEGFAEFMAYKTLEKVMPEYNAWKIFYERNKQAAYLTDSTKGTTPIYQEIPNLSAAKSVYGNIVYRKAPSFLRQAEFYLGEKEFQTAVKAFLKKHEFANAEWTDLVKEFETATKKDLKDWANVWIKQRGVILYRLGIDEDFFPKSFKESGNCCFGLYGENRSVDSDFPSGQTKSKTLAMKFKFLLVNRDETRSIIDFLPSTTEGKSYSTYTIDDFFPIRKDSILIFPNYQDYGYSIFLLDKKSRAYVLANIQTEKDDFLRAMMWGSLWDSVREAELAPQDYVELVVKNINVETDESTINTLLNRVSTTMNYYLSDRQINALAPRFENLLFEKMKNSFTPGERITYYRAFVNSARSPAAQNALIEILKGERYMVKGTLTKSDGFPPGAAFVPSLPELRAKDKFDIVTRLMILGGKDALPLLAELEKSETGDEAKRYAYAAKAAIATAENKAKFWNDFTNNREISESYVESAFAVFNSPKQADLTLPYLEKALTELPNLKRNRKIFFVNGWLAAFIGGQKSEEALKIVNDFLAGNPTLDKDLRLKILENADGLERAVKIRARFGNQAKN